MEKGTFLLVSIMIIFALAPVYIKAQGERIVRLEDLDITKITQGWGKPQKNLSVDGNPITINEKKFDRGVGTHATSRMIIDLKGGAKSFSAYVGMDDEIKKEKGSVSFRVYADEKKVFDSDVMKKGDTAKEAKADLTGANFLYLIVTAGGDGINFDHADWADAVIVMDEKSDAMPEAIDQPKKEKYILSPGERGAPRINCPDVIGAGENKDFLYYIPIVGRRPLDVAVFNLPNGLIYDSESNSIKGKTSSKGDCTITVTAKNKFGEDKKSFDLRVGAALSQTPPMGWNSWNCWGCAVDENKIKAAADAMAASGLINHGWSYINIDDCWQGKRDETTKKINSNEKFPDMKELADYIHSKGLKFGVYTDSGTKTCGGYEGSKGFEKIDALRYAEWGVDYVKCDWCNTEGMEPEPAYTIMGEAIKECRRDIVFSICNWGHKNPWEWGAKVGGNLWRTTGDIVDTWESMSKIGFSQARLAQYAQPGHWNDPDMLVIGKVGWGPNLRDSRLTPDEQYTHISLWCLLSSPLLLGCDLTQLDNFTLNLITNDEVLAINQDKLGKQAQCLINENDIQVWVKNLADGSKAVGIFDAADRDILLDDGIEFKLRWEDIKLTGKQNVRDVWKQHELGEWRDAITVKIPEHGVKLLKVTPVL
ncbi:NPCBM/NEW2 domain-containing protein [Candidatus Sumerlaeota bacterium]|nr:NPCBM/NEW2 domain-containing protein [Candidatus Sumerlaeota bacterium]